MTNRGYSFRSILCTALFVLALHSSTINAAQPAIRIFTDEAYPLSYTEADNSEVKGYATELVKAVLDEAGFSYTISVRSFARALSETKKAKNTLIYAISRTPEREADFNWLGQIIELDQYIYGLHKNKSLETNALEDLKNCAIGVINNDARHHYFVKKGFTNIVIVNSYEQMHKLLQRDRIQCFGASALGVHYFAKNYNLGSDYFVPLIPLKELQAPYYFATSILTEKDITDKIKFSFARLIENGTFLRIMQPIFEQKKRVE